MTNAELAILSLIAEQPRHGYNIEQVIAERGMRDWTEVGFSSIYYLLKKLAEAGHIRGRLQAAAGSGPARKVYAITDSGRAAWLAAIIEALSQPQRCYSSFQLGLASLPAVPPAEARAALREYSQNLRRQRAFVAERARAQQPLPDHVQAMFDLSLALITAELDWVEAYVSQQEKQQ